MEAARALLIHLEIAFITVCFSWCLIELIHDWFIRLRAGEVQRWRWKSPLVWSAARAGAVSNSIRQDHRVIEFFDRSNNNNNNNNNNSNKK